MILVGITNRKFDFFSCAFVSGKTYKLDLTELNEYGDCSLTVECVTVARKTRVRLPPFALLCSQRTAWKGGRYSLQNANFEVPENFIFSEPPFALSVVSRIKGGIK